MRFSPFIIDLLREKLGHEIRLSCDCDLLTLDIESMTGEHIGVNTMKRLLGLSSYLVWVGVKFSNAKEEELLINDASQIGSKKFDFSIE